MKRLYSLVTHSCGTRSGWQALRDPTTRGAQLHPPPPSGRGGAAYRPAPPYSCWTHMIYGTVPSLRCRNGTLLLYRYFATILSLSNCTVILVILICYCTVPPVLYRHLSFTVILLLLLQHIRKLSRVMVRVRTIGRLLFYS